MARFGQATATLTGLLLGGACALMQITRLHAADEASDLLKEAQAIFQPLPTG
jgi:hypothetical protein